MKLLCGLRNPPNYFALTIYFVELAVALIVYVIVSRDYKRVGVIAASWRNVDDVE